MRRWRIAWLLIATSSLALPGAAAASPTLALAPPVVDGQYVTLTGSISVPRGDPNCPDLFNVGCPVVPVLTSSKLPTVEQEIPAATTIWTTVGGTSPITIVFNYANTPFSLITGTIGVRLRAENGALSNPPATFDSNVQTFQYPTGAMQLTSVGLLRGLSGSSRHVVYRVRTGATEFQRGRTSATLVRLDGRRRRTVGRFRANAEPGQNVDRIPRRLLRRLVRNALYEVRLTVRDELGRRDSGRRRFRG